MSVRNQILGALTVGVPLGCVAGISLTIAAAKWLPVNSPHLSAWHDAVYYGVFVTAVAWALIRGAARSGAELLWLAAAATAAIPLSTMSSFILGSGWSHVDASSPVDVIAVVGAATMALLARSARKRAVRGPQDSIWSAPKSASIHDEPLSV